MHSRSLITAHRRWWDFVQPSLDTAAVMASLGVVHWIADRPMDDMALALGLVTVVVVLLLSQLTGLHRRPDAGNADREMMDVVTTWVIAMLALAVLGFATRLGQHFPRSIILSWAILAPALIGLGRMCLRIFQGGMLRRGMGVRRAAIVGLNELGRQTASNIQQEPALGLRVLGFFDDRTESREQTKGDEALAGDLKDLVELARRGGVDTVLITLPMRAEDRIKYLLDQLSDSTASVYIVPDFFVFELLHSRWTSMGGLPAVSVFENPLFGVDGVLKRVWDIAVAAAALVLAGIPMLLIAAAIKFSSPGPVFFRQRRYGLDGREILVWKFRSMRTCEDGPVIQQATKNDTRVTPIGKILRKSSLDELPQLFNVIAGTMSLVGPRPHATAHNEQYRSLIRGYMLRHKIKPGITGLAQVNGCRGETETVEKMQRRVSWDHRYIRNWSLWLDIKIMFKTLLVVWQQEEAY